MPAPDEISQYCSSLVVISGSRDVGSCSEDIQLSHYSVKEWLVSGLDANNFQEQRARLVIAETCLAYLLSIPGDLDTEEVTHRYLLAEYAARNWAEHAVVD
ncbi:uncharacterized protein B0I36DRAFT_355016 [Microdochium trichocladiopsis]|uniref:Uncharacterized protein n=1 Tax=Microdochium trichocladiopsis TaxID=1682393 RepID=A0A9P8XSN2_9PEZI|nr:uncharacterized protein B0I36DRAFT_355016 [Microdochium trichocladiopsis]KAH7016168.1 hypothetical protein B0I36DRAFT_355016 [Microdochium trichocladiopsis]